MPIASWNANLQTLQLIDCMFNLVQVIQQTDHNNHSCMVYIHSKLNLFNAEWNVCFPSTCVTDKDQILSSVVPIQRWKLAYSFQETWAAYGSQLFMIWWYHLIEPMVMQSRLQQWLQLLYIMVCAITMLICLSDIDCICNYQCELKLLITCQGTIPSSMYEHVWLNA